MTDLIGVQPPASGEVIAVSDANFWFIQGSDLSGAETRKESLEPLIVVVTREQILRSSFG